MRPREEPLAPWLAGETAEEKKKRARTIFRRLRKRYPDTHAFLDASTPLETVISTLLSAQSTDANVNRVTPALFATYRKPQDYLAAAPGALERDIHSTGFFNQKAKNIRALCQILIDDFGGEVPQTMDELLTLPGVARKTANIVLVNAFDTVAGVAVDTHVHRLARRLGFSEQDDPNKVERDLCALFPKSAWPHLNYLLIEHGRETCNAKSPKCESCEVAGLCPASRVPTRKRRS